MDDIKRITIIGVGLIGGSFARALRLAGLRAEFVGAGRNENNLIKAVELGVVDRYEMDLGKAVEGANIVVVCVPLGMMRAVFASIRNHLAPDVILTDVGSAKASVVADGRAVFGALPAGFVPGHPIAGNEKSGVEASFPELFRRRKVILTPVAESTVQAVRTVRVLWEAVGAQVIEMSVEHHDAVLAATSHLPHMLAYGLVDTLSRWDDSREIFQFAAGGFRDFTRIASSDPIMWRDICMANRDALIQAVERYMMDLGDLLDAVRCGDAERLERVFRHAKTARDRFSATLEQ